MDCSVVKISKTAKKRFFVEILCLTGKSWRELTINPTRFSFYPNVDRAASGQKCPFDGYKRKRERRTLSSPKQPSKGDVFPRPRRRRRRRRRRRPRSQDDLLPISFCREKGGEK